MNQWTLSESFVFNTSWRITATAPNGHAIDFDFRTEPNEHDFDFVLNYVSYLDYEAEAGVV